MHKIFQFILVNFFGLIAITERCLAGGNLKWYIPIDRNLLEETLFKVQYVQTICKSGMPIETLTTDAIMNKKDSDLAFYVETHISKFRCMYMFNVLQHMRLSTNLFKAHIIHHLSVPIIVKYKEIIQEMIAILYSLGVRELNALWLFYVYTVKLSTYLETKNISNIPNEANYNLLSFHISITSRLDFLSNIPYCEASERYECNFKSTDYNIQECADGLKKECLNKVELLVNKNISYVLELKKDLADHGIVPNNLEWFSIERLYINDVVKSDTLIKTLTEIFDVDVQWNSVQTDLAHYYTESHKIENLMYGTHSLRTHQISFLGFIKLFVIRMTRRHIMYLRREYSPVKKFINKLLHKENKQATYMARIRDMIKKFIDFFNLPIDDELQKLLKKFNRLKRYIYHVSTLEMMYVVPGEDALNAIKNLENSVIAFLHSVQLDPLTLSHPKSATFYRVLGFADTQKIDVGLTLEETLHLNSIDMNLTMMDAFYQYLKYNSIFQGMNFEVIVSFLTSVESHTHLQPPTIWIYPFTQEELAEKME